MGGRRYGRGLSEGKNSVTVHSSNKAQRELFQEERRLHVRGSEGIVIGGQHVAQCARLLVMVLEKSRLSEAPVDTFSVL